MELSVFIKVIHIELGYAALYDITVNKKKPVSYNLICIFRLFLSLARHSYFLNTRLHSVSAWLNIFCCQVKAIRPTTGRFALLLLLTTAINNIYKRRIKSKKNLKNRNIECLPTSTLVQGKVYLFKTFIVLSISTIHQPIKDERRNPEKYQRREIRNEEPSEILISTTRLITC